MTQSIRFKVGFKDGQADFTLLLQLGAEDRLASSLQVETASLPPNLAEQFKPEPGLAPAVEFLRLRLARWQAPSKRIGALVPGYSKVRQGLLAARAIGLEAMRSECPHFADWLKRLERLPSSLASSSD